MLNSLSVILVRTRFPENIGMTARAMANMGVNELILVQPEMWDKKKAAPLATSQGMSLLDAVRVEQSLQNALLPFAAAIGATARTGGMRTALLTPEKSAAALRSVCREGNRAALVFGSEDRGLSNEEAALCSHLATIPTAPASSLNLAQAILLMLYECLKADMALPFCPAQRGGWKRPVRSTDSRRATLEEEGLLLHTLEDTLLAINHLPADNPSWFMQPMRRFLRKSRLRRHEFDMLMGICRQVRRKIGPANE